MKRAQDGGKCAPYLCYMKSLRNGEIDSYMIVTVGLTDEGDGSPWTRAIEFKGG
jgi:hypothetical protein